MDNLVDKYAFNTGDGKQNVTAFDTNDLGRWLFENKVVRTMAPARKKFSPCSNTLLVAPLILN